MLWLSQPTPGNPITLTPWFDDWSAALELATAEGIPVWRDELVQIAAEASLGSSLTLEGFAATAALERSKAIGAARVAVIVGGDLPGDRNVIEAVSFAARSFTGPIVLHAPPTAQMTAWFGRYYSRPTDRVELVADPLEVAEIILDATRPTIFEVIRGAVQATLATVVK